MRNVYKHKPFSRPVVWRDGPGDTAENAFALLRGIGRHIDFQRVANLLSNGIHCTADYDKFITYLHNISAAFPGTFGIYRRKKCDPSLGRCRCDIAERDDQNFSVHNRRHC